jgi:prolyl oligopeptidase
MMNTRRAWAKGLRTAFLLACAALLPGGVAGAAAEPADPFLWLEQVDGPRAMQWVRAENQKTTHVLERDPRFAKLHADALALVQSKDRLPAAQLIDGDVYNFWQDPDHVRGLWRRTTRAGFAAAPPAWETVLDLDAVAASEHANWVWQGADCARPDQTRCLVTLSDGGEDASTVREFDLSTRAFVSGGFTLPTSKQRVVWEGADSILVARDWGAGTMTASGYPFVVKRLRRGESPEAAVELFRGKPTDVEVLPIRLDDGDGHQLALLLRGKTFFEHEHYLVRDHDVVRLGLPDKITNFALVAGQFVLQIGEAWSAGGTDLPAGAIVAMPLAAVLEDPGHLVPRLVYAPGERDSIDEFSATRSTLLVALYSNVRGRLLVFAPHADGSWTHEELPIEDMSSVSIEATDERSDRAYVRIQGFLTPPSQYDVDSRQGTLTRVRSLPAQFDGTHSVVEQHQAISSDGTRIPYFVVRPRDSRGGGSTPTVLYAYGGFLSSELPFYLGRAGKLWVERGGAFVLANIRGGGEFGPAWHEAGLKTHRQRIYDDFAAVGRDLVASGLTSPRRLGIQGGSNGGLLMGVEMTQHPEMWNAVDIQVPLLDMLRYEKIAAGASWVGEYGSVSVPEERRFLASTSPYHQLRKDKSYPLALVWTTTKDDRVGPQHARKFAAKLAQLGKPRLYYEVIEGGHDNGANLRQKAHTTALEWTYFSRQLMD